MTTRAPGRPELHQPTGDTRIDAALRSVVGAYEERFPGRARSYYLFGSYAVGTATVNSDIDVYVIFRAEFLDGERERVAALASECERDSPAPLELIVRAEGDDFFFAFCTEPLKTASRLLFGEDIRDRVAPPDIDTFVAVGLSSDPLLRLGETRGRPDVLRYPLEHPDSSAPFQGYTPARAGPKLRHPLQRLYRPG
jgi:predicted nucleotidyltransferase